MRKLTTECSLLCERLNCDRSDAVFGKMYPIIHHQGGTTCHRGYFSVRSLEEWLQDHAPHTDWSDGPNRLWSLGYALTDIERVETAARAAADEGWAHLENKHFSVADVAFDHAVLLCPWQPFSPCRARYWPDRLDSPMIWSRVQRPRTGYREIVSGVLLRSVAAPPSMRCSR